MCSVLPNLLQMGKDQQISLPQKLTIEQHQHQQYALKWSEFQSSIINCFQRLRDEEDFVDVTISCDQRSFTAHRVVLSACSPYFRKLLKSNPCKHPIIILRDVRSDDMECLLSFMYNGEVNVAHDQLPDFLKTAHLLQIRGLADVTENWRSSGHITATKPIDNSIFLNKKYQHDPDKDNYGAGTAEKANLLPKCKSSSERPVSSTMVSSYSNDMNRNSPVLKEIKTPVPTPENMDLHRSRKILLTPPPQKRIKSADLFRAQHGINTSLPLSEGEFSAISQHSLTRERRHNVSDFERKMERIDVKSTNDESGDDESNCSSDYTIERVGNNQEINDSEDNSRPMMHNVFLGAAKPLEQQSLLNLSDFGTQRQLEIRVRATDPRPCPKCGKIYRSAHTLRTHLEDKHTVCPGYRCVLCGTVAKSRNSLHSHMSRQHRGISTKDLPVLPMPCAFDPILASRLLAKAGVKISPDDLHDRASSANSLNISGGEYGYNNQQDIDNCEKNDQFDDNPEDLTAGGINFSSGSTSDDNKQTSLLNLEHANASISQMRNDAAIAAAVALNQKELSSEQSTTNQPLLDLQLLQFLTENAFGMGITQDPRAAATLHAAKIAHLSAIGKSFDNLPSSLIQAQLDLSKEQNSKGDNPSKGCRSEGFQIGSILRQHTSYDTPLNDQIFSNIRKEQNTSEITTSKDASQPITASQAKDVKTYDLIEDGDLNEKKSPNA